MPYIEATHGAKLHYFDDDHTAPWIDAPTIILQHGFSRSGAFWYAWVPLLSGRYRVVRPTLRGLGKSQDLGAAGSVADINIPQYVDDLILLIESLGAGPVHYCGESLGGLIGVNLAAKRPDLVATLTMVSPFRKISDRVKKLFAQSFGTWQEALQAQGVEGYVRAQTHRFPPGTDPREIDWRVGEMATSPLESVIALSRVAGGTDITSTLPHVTVPTLLIGPGPAQVSTDSTVAEVKLIEGLLPDARSVVVDSPSAGICFSSPGACATAMLHFIESR